MVATIFKPWERVALWLLTALFFVSLLAPSCVEAEEVSLTWQNATQNTDGSTIPTTGNAALAATVLNWSLCDPGDVLKPIRKSLEVNPDLTGFQFNISEPGDYCFSAYHRNVGGTWSAMSGVAKKTVAGDPTEPPPPTGQLKVVNEKAYSVAKINDGFLLIVIGTVPLGTDCIMNQTVNGKYAVPNTAVTFSGTNDSGTVVADCG